MQAQQLKLGELPPGALVALVLLDGDVALALLLYDDPPNILLTR